MSKSIVIIIVFILFISSIFLLSKPHFPRSFHHQFTEHTDLHNENINGFYLFDDIHSDRFISFYGEQKHKSRDTETFRYYKIQDGLEIATNEQGGIFRFIVESSGIPTAKGIEVGDSISKAKKAYGENFYERTEQGADILGYVDQKNHQSIEFWYGQNGILFYRLDDNSMN
ncbi:hypothetical protein [Neobacillus sp. PS2-9]|uniref:hypothetical protein n=1 Tax=Neobacillus sp. PS2-9 TaxID=3070676 RepID=UPI0027E1EB16|nr:hypothetical protein [Neobacillus sp. PS2-9]WML57631.1 hypothetical protein RCG25_22455 [Neobacillus sp. PS2-9]